METSGKQIDIGLIHYNYLKAVKKNSKKDLNYFVFITMPVILINMLS